MKKLIPYILIIIRSIIFGSTVLFTRQLLQGAFVFDVLATRFLLTAFFFILLKLTGIIHVSFRGKDMRFPMLTALCEPGCYFIFETFGIMGTTTVLAGILLAMSSAVIIILETVFLKEKTTILQKLCLLIRILGGIVVVAFGVNSGKNTAWGIGGNYPSNGIRSRICGCNAEIIAAIQRNRNDFFYEHFRGSAV